jgi:hypothetical protein
MNATEPRPPLGFPARHAGPARRNRAAAVPLRPIAAKPHFLLAARFRRHPAYALHRLGALPEAHREALGALADGASDDAVLLPLDPHSPRSAKLIDARTADLLAALSELRPLPSTGAAPAADAWRQIQLLVLDGLLEIESHGRLFSGPAAHPVVIGERPLCLGGGALARLSIDALLYAERLPITDPRALSRRLYGYNRIPPHAAWQARFGTPDAYQSALGLSPGGPLAEPLSHYQEERTGGWRAWSLGRRAPGELTHKLYLSPHPESLPAAFRAAVECFAESGVEAFKIGHDLAGLLRPDKIVAYFPDLAAVRAVADRLAPRLAGVRPHGVPFSAELTADGLLSWGSDPPIDEALVPWRGLESWRLWISNQLASSLLAARAAAADPAADPVGRAVEPCRFALDRLRLDGVDIATWSPAASSPAAVGLEADR